jgi:hypothetical protein
LPTTTRKETTGSGMFSSKVQTAQGDFHHRSYA